MQFSKNGIDFMVEVAEGREYSEYPDTAGNPTIGIGHKLTVVELGTGSIVIQGSPVEYKNGLTHSQVDDLFLQDMYPVEKAINELVKVPLTQNQFDALCSLCFNIGIPRFTKSTLLRLLNTGNYVSVPEQMRRWNKETIKGVLTVSKGLTNRREFDISLWAGIWHSKKVFR